MIRAPTFLRPPLQLPHASVLVQGARRACALLSSTSTRLGSARRPSKTSARQGVLLRGRHVVFDDILSISFTAPTLWDPWVLRGRIVWVRTEEVTARMGVALEHQSAQAVLTLHELIVGLAYD
jgi:hypothetical protein